MSICDSILLAKYQQLLATAARNNLNNNNNSNGLEGAGSKIWNPAFTESDYERRTKLILGNQVAISTPGLGFLAAQHVAAARVSGLFPPSPHKLMMPTAVHTQIHPVAVVSLVR